MFSQLEFKKQYDQLNSNFELYKQEKKQEREELDN